MEGIGTAEEVFNYRDMFLNGEKCCRGVMWKQSAQNFHRHLFSRTAVNRKRALNNYKPRRLVSFKIHERGKVRPIDAPHIDDRQIQKTLCRKVLLPMYKPRMIYDNGASLEGKGLEFSQRQLDKALRNHIKQYGLAGWVITADFKGFFPNADRDIIIKRHGEIPDPKLREIADTITRSGKGDRGLPLGVEPSQMEMIALPSPLDNYMACQMQLKGFGHYMDDYHIFVPPGRDPEEIMQTFIRKASELGITVSMNKTRITPLGEAFRYCKMKRQIIGGRVVKNGCRNSYIRARRKIKMFARAEMSYEDIYTSVTSTLSYFDKTNNHNSQLRLKQLFFSLFGFSCENIEEFRRRDAIRMSSEIQEKGSVRTQILL